ncbi:hypothetical protein BDN72DRAFT_722675, partial [Pluteus cervinus]
GFVVPLTYDDPGPCGNFIDGTVSICPQPLHCSNSINLEVGDTTYHQYHMEVNPSRAWYI